MSELQSSWKSIIYLGPRYSVGSSKVKVEVKVICFNLAVPAEAVCLSTIETQHQRC